jgi:hypothetical protein
MPARDQMAIWRWVQGYGPELERGCVISSRRTNLAVDET